MSKYVPKYPIQPKSEQEREFRKAYYIADSQKRLERIREVVKMDTSRVKINAGVDTDWKQKYSIALRDSSKKKKIEELEGQGFLYGWAYEATKRRLEVELYIENIIKQANKKESNKDKIDFLINKQFEFHNDVFDNELENIAFKEEVEEFIVDQLQEKVRAISNKDYEPTGGVLKPLKWTLNDNILGTIFACLYAKQLIDGSRQDIVRFLTSAFPDISESSLEDTLKFKEGAYQKETKELTEKYVEDLPKKTKSTKGKNKNIP